MGAADLFIPAGIPPVSNRSIQVNVHGFLPLELANLIQLDTTDPASIDGESWLHHGQSLLNPPGFRRFFQVGALSNCIGWRNHSSSPSGLNRGGLLLQIFGEDTAKSKFKSKFTRGRYSWCSVVSIEALLKTVLHPIYIYMLMIMMIMMMMLMMLMMLLLLMMMMMRRPSSLRVRAKPRHLPYIYIHHTYTHTVLYTVYIL